MIDFGIGTRQLKDNVVSKWKTRILLALHILGMDGISLKSFAVAKFALEFYSYNECEIYVKLFNVIKKWGILLFSQY